MCEDIDQIAAAVLRVSPTEQSLPARHLDERGDMR